MEKYYKLGPVTLCMRNWPRDLRWPFAMWKLDAYETPIPGWAVHAAFDRELAVEEGEQWQLLESTATAKRMEQQLPGGWLLWKQVQSDGAQLKFAILPEQCRVVLMEDSTNTCAMAALEALTFFVLPMLLLRKILTFHGVLLEHKGQGILLCAPSGVGKTTHARLWREHKNAWILNGDRSPCYEKDGAWVAFGTPWCGTSGEHINRQVPVKALVLLRRGQRDQIVPMSAMEVVTQVLELAVCPAWPGFRERVLALVDEFLKAVPVTGLACTPTEKAVQVLDAWLEALP